MFDYINEAFKKLSLINEEAFDTSLDGINQLSDFKEKDDAEDLVKIIDPEAESEEELQDSYIGKVITNCNVCHSHIFENKEDITLDEDGVVNVSKECPYCGESDGFVIIGEIKEFTEVPQEDSTPSVKVDGQEIEPTKSVTEGFLGAVKGAVNGLLGEEQDDLDEGSIHYTNGPSRVKQSQSYKGAFFNFIDKDILSYIKNEVPETPITSNDIKCSKSAPLNALYYVNNGEDVTLYFGNFLDFSQIGHVWIEHNGEILETGVPPVSSVDHIVIDSVTLIPNDIEGARQLITRKIHELNSTHKGYRESVEEGLIPSIPNLLGEDTLEEAGDTRSWYPRVVFTVVNSERKKCNPNDAGEITDQDVRKILDYIVNKHPVTSKAIASNPQYGSSFDTLSKFIKTGKVPPNLYWDESTEFEEGLLNPLGSLLGEDSEVNEAKDLSSIDGTIANVLVNHTADISACGSNEQAVKNVITSILSSNEVKDKTAAQAAIAKINSCHGAKLWSTIGTYMTGDKVVKLYASLDKDLQEDVNNVDVETDDSIVSVHSEEGGKVTVSTEPKDPLTTDEESMGPVSDETMNEIETNNGIEEEPAEDEESVDMEIEEVDEEGMDELGESYLKNVYENVKSFKTTSISSGNTHMVVEGLITFKSGAKKHTGFIFEAHSATADGKVKFIGKNEHFSRGRKSFTLTGTVNNKKLLPESLTYNYRAKNAEGKSNRIYGTVHNK